MYAHDLRKWSLAKFLMFQWLPVLMLLVYWCHGAAGMHLAAFQSSPTVSVTTAITSISSPHSIKHLDTALNANINNQKLSFNRNSPIINYGENISLFDLSKRLKISETQEEKEELEEDEEEDKLKRIWPITMMGSRHFHERFERVKDDDDQYRRKRRFQRKGFEKLINYGMNVNATNDEYRANIRQFKQSPQALWAARLKEKRARNQDHRYQLSHMAPSIDDTKTLNGNIYPTIGHQRHLSAKSFQFGRNRRESRNENNNNNRHHQQSGGMGGSGGDGGGRIKSRRFCSARDPATLAFEAPTVFEGKVRSMSSDRRRNFSVTFEVKEVYKRQLGYKLPLLVRLQFSYRNNSECDIYKETLKPRGFVRDELEQGKLYILFVQQIDIGNYTILGQPIKRTRKVVNEIRNGVSEKYGQRASIESLLANTSNAREGRRLRIVCKVRGQPPPKVTWFKDGRSISRNRVKYQFIHLRKRAELIIKSAAKNDSGQYECRAKNKIARQPVARSTKIEILPREYEVTTLPNNWTNLGSPCPDSYREFCFNGGTCVFFTDVGEPACKCPDGYVGNRCGLKQPSTYNQKEPQCGENTFRGSYYC